MFFPHLLRSPMPAVGVLLVCLHMAVALAAPWLIPHDPFQLKDLPFAPPGIPYFLGTDDIGRDFLSRVLMGGRTCILVALVSGALAALGGGLVGLFAAYLGGFWDDVISRIVEMKIAIPSILFVSLFVTGFGQSVVVLVAVIGLIKMMGVIRTARAQGLVLMSQGFIIAARLRRVHGTHHCS